MLKHSQFFTKISKENQEKIERSFKVLHEDCKQKLGNLEGISNTSVVIRDNILGLDKLLTMIEKDLKHHLDEAVEKTLEKLTNTTDEDSEVVYTNCWFYLDDFLPDLLNWFNKIICKILIAMRSDRPIDIPPICQFFLEFVNLFRIPVLPIIDSTLNFVSIL